MQANRAALMGAAGAAADLLCSLSRCPRSRRWTARSPRRPVGTIGPSRRFSVQNTGTADVTLDDIVAGTTSQAGSNGLLADVDFLLGSTYCQTRTLVPGDSCQLFVRFAPSAAGGQVGMAGVYSADGVYSAFAYFTASGLAAPVVTSGTNGADGAPGATGATGSGGREPGPRVQPGRRASRAATRPSSASCRTPRRAR